MSSRFVSNLTALLAGGFLLTSSLVFSTTIVGWLGLAVGAFVAQVVLCAFALRGRGLPQRVLDGFVLVVAVWAIVASRCFGAPALEWLMFASGALVVLLAVTGLIVHEVLLELALRRRSQAPIDSRITSTPREPAPLGIVGSG